MTPQNVLHFWFTESTPKDWFAKSDTYDAAIRERFLDIHQAILRGETADWRKTPEGRLAEILVIDQFSRNMFRGTKDAFASDDRARTRSYEAIQSGADIAVPKRMRHFFYMPLMHSEVWSDHRWALWLFLKSFNMSGLRFEIDHARVIWKFGRYPSRNAILGRVSTPEEIEFLKRNPGW